MSQIQKTIQFGKFTERIPPGIPKAVQQATARFWTSREARVAELPQWEELRQVASDIRLHTLRHLDHTLEIFVKKFTETGGHVHWAADARATRTADIELTVSLGVHGPKALHVWVVK